MTNQELETKIKQALTEVEHPVARQSLAQLNAFIRLEQEDEKMRLYLKTDSNDKKQQIDLEAKIRGAMNKAELPSKIRIKFEVHDDFIDSEAGNRIRGVKNIIAIGSGKGGVGKSTVAANLALAFSQAGHKVGLIDADIYGPSIGKMFGKDGKQILKADGKNTIFPHESFGMKIISFSFMLGDDQAVVWRGPMLGKAIEQFLFQVSWGELDYLFIDLPPGTGDVQLSLAQLIDLDGALIVTTPQNVALQDASRAINMFMEVKIPVLGVIENMSVFLCPNCGHEAHIFSKNGGTAIASKYHIPILGQIPIQSEIMHSGETGTPVVFSEPEGQIAAEFIDMMPKIISQIEKYKV